MIVFLFSLYKKVVNKIDREVFHIFQKKLYGCFGRNSYIKNSCLVVNKKYIFIGNNVYIRNYARIEPVVSWKDKKYSPKIIIGDNVSIEQGLHLTCANKVEIQDGCLITPYCSITDIDHSYEDISKRILEQELDIKETIIGKNSMLGTGSKIMAGVTIGEHCIIGANSVVTKDIPDYCVAVGTPARIIKRYNFKTNAWERTDSKGIFI
jgi:acetyltransferase-like isoleucine patch superfamily enzyme